MEQYEKAVEDCNQAIRINNRWTKAYFRKAVALQELAHLPGTALDAIEALREGLKIASTEEDQDLTSEFERLLT